MKILHNYLLIIIFFININKANSQKFSRDLVPDKETAIKIATTIWYPIYGKSIYEELPFNATLKDSIWVVTGTLNNPLNGKPSGPGNWMKGGVALIEISKNNARVIKISHGK